MVQKYILAGVAAIGIGAAAGFASQRDIAGAAVGGAAAVSSTIVGIAVAGNGGSNKQLKEQLEQKVAELETQLKSARAESNQTSDRVTEEQNEIAQLSSQLLSAQAEAEQLQSQIAELQDAQQALESSKQNAERELSELRSSLDETIQVEESAGVDLASARQQLEELTQQQQQLQEDVSLKQQTVSELQASEAELNQTIANRQSELEQLQTQINELNVADQASEELESIDQPEEPVSPDESLEEVAASESSEQLESAFSESASTSDSISNRPEADPEEEAFEAEATADPAISEGGFAEGDLFGGESEDETALEPEDSAEPFNFSAPLSLESSEEVIAESDEPLGEDSLDDGEAVLMESTSDLVSDDDGEATDENTLSGLLSESPSDALLDSTMDSESLEDGPISEDALFESLARESTARTEETLEEPEFTDEMGLGELLGEDATEIASDEVVEAFTAEAFYDGGNADALLDDVVSMEDSKTDEDVSLSALLSEPPESESTFEMGDSVTEVSAEAEAADAASLDELLGAIEGSVVEAAEEEPAEEANDVDAFFSSVDRSSVTELTAPNAPDSEDGNLADLFNGSSGESEAEAVVAASLEHAVALVEQESDEASEDLESLNLAELLSEADD
ncbi:MAG: hypothetical protein AB4050_12855 [Synechococcus sp.]